MILSNVFLYCCSNSEATTGSQNSTSTSGSVQRIELVNSISPSCIDNIRADPSSISDFFPIFKNEIQNALHFPLSVLSDEELFAIYCSIVAYSLAPYGRSQSIELPELLLDEALDCDNYCLLTRYLFVEGIRQNGMQDMAFSFVGWDCGAIGNHAQIFVTMNNRSLLLDPTIGIAALTDFNSVASGKFLQLENVLDLSTRAELSDYRSVIIEALAEGLFQPSDLLYFFNDFEKYKYPATGSSDWSTPAANLCY